MANDHIRLEGVRVHNLKNVDVTLPKRRVIVLTGPSGSGKSSLAFDTLYAEGQRRYIESLSTYARQFLGAMERPAMDRIVGLSPTVSVEQKAVATNPRSTVGTVAEIHDHLRLLYAKAGTPYCPTCSIPVESVHPDELLKELMALGTGTKVRLMAPVVRQRKGEFKDLFVTCRGAGYPQVRVDGAWHDPADLDRLSKNVRHDIDVVVDKIVLGRTPAARLQESLADALRLGEGQVLLLLDNGDHEGEERLRSTRSQCAGCGRAMPAITHQSFSFNSPLGQCPTCKGLGTEPAMDATLVVTDPAAALPQRCIGPLALDHKKSDRAYAKMLEAACKELGIPWRTPWQALPAVSQQWLLYGHPDPLTLRIPGRKTPLRAHFDGVLAELHRRYLDAETEAQREDLRPYLSSRPCPTCEGERLSEESRAVRLCGHRLPELSAMSIADAHRTLEGFTLAHTDVLVVGEVLERAVERLGFLVQVGLGYLTLNRGAPTLSGGEAQRVRLAAQLGSDLSGVTYVLDEPSIGLHQRDNRRLIAALKRLRDQGNTVVVVEHDRETIEEADHVIDFGPGAGSEGGQILFQGPPSALAAEGQGITADYLSGRRCIEPPSTPREAHAWLRLTRVRHHNLRDISLDLPLGVFVGISGVSGAGKSTLLHDVLVPNLERRLRDPEASLVGCATLEGIEAIDKLIEIDQRPIGRTPRSNPATYTKVFDEIRKLFAEMPEAKMFGYTPGRFSFNTEGGRCESCQGSGVVKLSMYPMPDAYLSCDACQGRRFNDATLRVRFQGKNIADVLEMPIAQALEHFHAHPRIRKSLQTLADVGLGYLPLGQPSTTLSGGEAQRIKLSRELVRSATGKTFYLLDEPTTGLHFEDIQRLIAVLQRLVAGGNTVVVIEHNLDLLKCVDHLIDLGPEGGTAGGEIVAAGSPAQVALAAQSHTGSFLADLPELRAAIDEARARGALG